MHAVRLEIVCVSVSVATTRCHRGGVRSPNEKFWTGLQWSPPDVQMSLAGGRSQVWCGGRGGGRFPGLMSREGLPTMRHISWCTEWLVTDTCENITFPQLRWRAVNIPCLSVRRLKCKRGGNLNHLKWGFPKNRHIINYFVFSQNSVVHSMNEHSTLVLEICIFCVEFFLGNLKFLHMKKSDKN